MSFISDIKARFIRTPDPLCCTPVVHPVPAQPVIERSDTDIRAELDALRQSIAAREAAVRSDMKKELGRIAKWADEVDQRLAQKSESDLDNRVTTIERLLCTPTARSGNKITPSHQFGNRVEL